MFVFFLFVDCMILCETFLWWTLKHRRRQIFLYFSDVWCLTGCDAEFVVWMKIMVGICVDWSGNMLYFFKDCYKGLNKFISKTHTHNADILLMFYETRCVDIFFVKIVQKTWKTISCIRNDRSILLDFQNNNVSSMCEKFSVKFSGKFETKCSHNIIFLQKLNISHISLIFYRWPKNNC